MLTAFFRVKCSDLKYRTLRICVSLSNCTNLLIHDRTALPESTCLNRYFRARDMLHRAPFTRRQCKYVNPQNDGRVRGSVHIWEGPSRKQKMTWVDVEKRLQSAQNTPFEIFKMA